MTWLKNEERRGWGWGEERREGKKKWWVWPLGGSEVDVVIGLGGWWVKGMTFDPFPSRLSRAEWRRASGAPPTSTQQPHTSWVELCTRPSLSLSLSLSSHAPSFSPFRHLSRSLSFSQELPLKALESCAGKPIVLFSSSVSLQLLS